MPEFIAPQDGVESRTANATPPNAGSTDTAHAWAVAPPCFWATICSPPSGRQDGEGRRFRVFTCEPTSHRALYDSSTEPNSADTRRKSAAAIRRDVPLSLDRGGPARSARMRIPVTLVGFEIVRAKAARSILDALARPAFPSRQQCRRDRRLRLARAGRSRTSFNVAEKSGFELEHDFGHGSTFSRDVAGGPQCCSPFAWQLPCPHRSNRRWPAARQHRSRRRFYALFRKLTAYVLIPTARQVSLIERYQELLRQNAAFSETFGLA